MLGLDPTRRGLALRMALAAILAFSIAALLNVHNAYWAAMPVWVVAQSSRGLLIERGVFRILGTLVGAAAGFALLAFTRNPVILLTALGLWVALMAGLTHVVAGVKSYGVMLAGMTTAVVLLPSLHAGEHLLPLAIARVECTLIGVLVVTLVTGWWTPMASRHDFYQRVRQMAADATAFAALAVAGRDDDQTAALEQQVLREIVDTDALARTTSAGSLEGYRRLRHTTALTAASLSLMASARGLRARHARGDQAMGVDALDTRRLGALRHIEQAGQALHDGRPAAGGQPDIAAPRDWHKARKRGLVAGLATYAASMFGLWSGWGAGELMALGVCIFSMVLGSLPTPRVVAPKLLVGVLAGVAAAMFYRFFLQPHVGGTASLIASVVPFILVGAWARMHPRTAMPALDANMCFMLGSQAGMPAVGAAEILGGSAALALAAVLVALTLLVAPDARDARLRVLVAGLPKDLGRRQSATARRVLQVLAEFRRGQPTAALPTGLLGVIGFGEVLASLQANGGEAAAVLRNFAVDPQATADAASRQSGTMADPTAALALRDAADALRSCAGWLGRKA